MDYWSQSAQWIWVAHALMGFAALCLTYALMHHTKGYLRHCFFILLLALVAYVFFHLFIIFGPLFAPKSLNVIFLSAVLHVPFLVLLLLVLWKLLRLVKSISEGGGGKMDRRSFLGKKEMRDNHLPMIFEVLQVILRRVGVAFALAFLMVPIHRHNPKSE